MIISLFGAGLSISDIAIALSRDKRIVKKWYKRWNNMGEVNAIKQLGRLRAITSDEDLYISLHAIHKPLVTN